MNDFMDGLLGSDGWAYCWLKDGEAIGFEGVCGDFETSYEAFFKTNGELFERLVTFGDVYDTDPENVRSGLDYYNQSGPVHIQDIALRNVVAGRGRSFTEGAELLRVRSNAEHEIGRQLSPFNVPYYKPEFVLPSHSPAKPSWQPDSIEAFYQLNRRLAVAEFTDSSTIVAVRSFITLLPRVAVA